MTRWPNTGLLCRTKNYFFIIRYIWYPLVSNAVAYYLRYLYLGSTLGTFPYTLRRWCISFFKGLEREFWLRLFLAYKFALQAILLNTVLIYTMYLILHNLRLTYFEAPHCIKTINFNKLVSAILCQRYIFVQKNTRIYTIFTLYMLLNHFSR